MSKYIDANAIEKWIKRDEWGTPDERWRPESEFGRMIDALPAADVEEVRHGEWIDGNRFQPCSECHKRGKRSWKYCPKCGAKMDGILMNFFQID